MVYQFQLSSLVCVIFYEVIHEVYGLQLAPNFEVLTIADKNFYLRLAVEKVSVSAVLTKKYLRSYG